MKDLDYFVERQGIMYGEKIPTYTRGGLILKHTRPWDDNYNRFKEFLNKVLDKEEYNEVLAIYPVYYMGWEMDNWGAIVKKENGDVVQVETNHGALLEHE